MKHGIRNGIAGGAALAASLVVLLALPVVGSAGKNPVNDVVNNLRGTVNNALGQGGGSGAAQQQQGGGGQSAPRQGSPSAGGYVPPLHGANPHGQGTVGTVDLGPSSVRPLSGDPAGGDGSGEEAVVGRARGEQGADGRYNGHITVLALLGNEIIGVDTNEGESANGPLQAIQNVLNGVCSGSGQNVCLTVLRADSTTTSNGSTNAFEAANVRLLDASGQGITAAAAQSNGNISEDSDCQTAHGDTTVVDANVGGSALADVSQSSSDSQACNDGRKSVSQSSSVIGLGGSGVPIPAPGCANGTPNTLTGIPGLAPIVCNANDQSPAGAQASAPYGVREALTVFALDVGGSSLLKTTTAASESKATAPGDGPAPEPAAGLIPDPDPDPDDNDRRGDRGDGGDGGDGAGGILTAAGDGTGDGNNAVCEDGVDNDGDGKTDFPDDPGCSSANDDSEDDGRLATTGGSLLLMLLLGAAALAVGLRLRARVSHLSA